MKYIICGDELSELNAQCDPRKMQMFSIYILIVDMFLVN